MSKEEQQQLFKRFFGLSSEQLQERTVNSPSSCQGNDVNFWNNCFGIWAGTNGDKYWGEFSNGKRSGKGIYSFFKGEYSKTDTYDGEWLDGRQNGLGVLTYGNGEKYVGDFKNGIFSGQGTFSYENGNKYTGEFKDGKRNGQGTFFYLANNPFKGNKYVGEWKDNERHGQGALFSSNGVVLSDGIWAGGTFLYSSQNQQPTPSNNEIEKLRAEAEDAKRKQTELESQLRLAQQQQPQTTTPIASAPSIGKRVALVVGNANYKIRPLKNPRNDADDISRSLRSSGFEVIDLRDASLQQMRNGVRQFGDRLINNDVGLVYYSGHGVEVKGRNYFIPVNADIQREDEIADQGLDVSLILEKMNTAGKGVNILIVDACRDDPFGRSFRSSSRGLAQMDAPRGTIIAYATSPGKVASDGDPKERNSPYTKNLVKAMQQPNKPIEQVFKEVRRAVQEETKNQQTPWENTSLSGDFYFKISK
jgi:hypothetical protein